jgi:DNA-binding NtrC family response regulator
MRRPIPMVAECACGEWVIGVDRPEGQKRYWCKACIGFVDAILRASMPRAQLPERGIALDTYLDQLSRSLTEQALARAGGRKAAAARLLGINRTTLVERLKRMGAE